MQFISWLWNCGLALHPHGLEGAWEFDHMCFVVLEKAFDRVLQAVQWGVLWEYRVLGLLIQAVRSLYDWCQSLAIRQTHF